MTRRPQDREHYERKLKRLETEAVGALAATGDVAPVDPQDRVFEAIVREDRPVLFVRDAVFDTDQVTTLGPEAVDLVKRMKDGGDRLVPLLPLIGRLDVLNFPGVEFVGTGWFIATDIVVTNRHVASLIAKQEGRRFVFTRGVGGRLVSSSFCNAHEFDDLAPDSSRVFDVTEVLYIEPENGPNDIAFLRVPRRTDGRGPSFISVSPTDVADDVPVCVVGYPARASKRVIPDQALMNDLYRGRFDVKRAAPGFSSGTDRGATTHDCTTLGGNSGSVVLDLATGTAVGLHFAGLFRENNFAVRASVLTEYIRGKRWTLPAVIETRPPVPASPAAVPHAPALSPLSSVSLNAAASSAGSASVVLPLIINFNFSLGTPQVSVGIGVPAAAATGPLDLARVEAATASFWEHRPAGVIAVRVGYLDDGDRIGDVPCIAASVLASQLAAVQAAGPSEYQGVSVRYLPADLDEQLQSIPALESVDEIDYDDSARTGTNFSFDVVDEEDITVKAHVGPEYSWDVLEEFLDGANDGAIVSAIYEFHGKHIKNALERRLEDGASLTLVADNLTFIDVKHKDEEFDRIKVFDTWEARNFKFKRIVAPEGTAGLISDAYHIKVTVREDDTFWLSSGNWKMGSSQPIITSADRDNATDTDLPGNREWHVVINSPTLARRFRSHILQDFKRSKELGGLPVPRSKLEETFVDLPIEETVLVEERKPPSHILKPKDFSGRIKVRPLLTPDQEGAIYSEAVLELIESATSSLLFQIPYISMPPNPQAERGFIDKLIEALTQKLKTIDDARVLLRSGSSKLSSPAHAGWFFKSKGVDIDNRLRVIENHHTKGMVVDGQRVLLGSHNWSKPGVTLNRDASLIFDNADIAAYYAEAFDIDWQRANKVKPKKFVPETVLEATGIASPPGFERVPLSDLLADD
jgi:hypothetical protein